MASYIIKKSDLKKIYFEFFNNKKNKKYKKYKNINSFVCQSEIISKKNKYYGIPNITKGSIFKLDDLEKLYVYSINNKNKGLNKMSEYFMKCHNKINNDIKTHLLDFLKNPNNLHFENKFQNAEDCNNFKKDNNLIDLKTIEFLF